MRGQNRRPVDCHDIIEIETQFQFKLSNYFTNEHYFISKHQNQTEFQRIHSAMHIVVEAHNPRWKHDFTIESERLKGVLGDYANEIHHIGSTSIPGIFAKPIIDILIDSPSLAQIDLQSSKMESIGYEAMGEFGIEGRRYYRKSNAQGVRTHHIHIFATGSDHLYRHIVFQDYLIAHPEIAQSYSQLKSALTAQKSTSQSAYIQGKDPFIKEHEAAAIRWALSNDSANQPETQS